MASFRTKTATKKYTLDNETEIHTILMLHEGKTALDTTLLLILVKRSHNVK